MLCKRKKEIWGMFLLLSSVAQPRLESSGPSSPGDAPEEDCTGSRPEQEAPVLSTFSFPYARSLLAVLVAFGFVFSWKEDELRPVSKRQWMRILGCHLEWQVA